MKYFITLLLLLIISTFSLNAQMTDEQIDEFIKTASAKEMVQKNTVLMMDGFFNQSIKIADELLKKEPNNSNFNYRKGFAVYKSTSDFSEAIPYLLIGKENININIDLLSPNEKAAPLEALFYLGRSYHLVNNISAAKEQYQAYIDSKPKDNERVKDAFLMLKQCKNAEVMMAFPKEYEILNLGDKINSEYPDYAPIISLDGSVLYFTSRRLRADGSNKDIKEPYKNLYNEDVYRSNRIDLETWGKPEIMEFSLPERNEATVAVSSDERTFYIYKDDAGNGDIFETEYKDNKFENLVPIKIKGVNTDAWEPHITSSADGKYKYFSSDREGGFGGRDIYRITKLPNGEWSEPMNLGPTINTEYDEDSPFISIDNRTLYFSHNGDKSIGGFDVFVSFMDNEDQSWSEPINLGVPLNSTGDDIYYTTTADGLRGFYTSFRADGYGEKDIYEVRNKHLGVDNISVLFGEIETINQSPLPEDIAFTVKCLDCNEPYEFTFFPRISDGTFFASLYSCHEYEITFHHKKGQVEITKEIVKTDCSEEYEEIYRHLVLDVPGMTLVLPKDLLDSYEPMAMKHFFGYNKNELNPEKGALKIFLDSLNSQIAKGRTSIEIEVNASASTVPTKTFRDNKILAEKRAKGVEQFLRNYFLEKGLADSIHLSVNNIEVSGPNYTGDYDDEDKYAPYQYVELSLNGINSISNESLLISSTDENSALVKTHQVKDHQGDLFTSGELKDDGYEFHVVIGVFSRIHFAEGMVKSTIKKGYDSKMIGKRNDMYVVSAGSAHTKEEAVEILSRVREEVIQSAWILNIKQ